MTALATSVPVRDDRDPAAPRRRSRRRTAWLPTAVLLIGAVYCLLPVAWVVAASTKSGSSLFTTFTFAPGGDFLTNLGDLSEGGVYWKWMLNSLLYAGAGGLLSASVSGLSGYTLAKYRFPGRGVIFNVLLAGVLVPGVTLAIPQYLLLAKVGMTDTYWAVLLPNILSPYGIYLARIYAAAAVPDTVLEAARTDGASEGRIFGRVALPMMLPGLVTVFLFQFVAIWNNFLLPFVMLSDDDKFPVTVGLFTLLNQGQTVPALYSVVIIGVLISIVPLIALFLLLQRYWRLDLVSGSVKG
ncbi:carbohydrate ABC transporter permease [Actinoplanes sp. NPDC048791]|uniref:carbohydrate ABC transporter permease n=1 Tax=Actinoplanes sp. NPDC048791 TaxID=3154623 RepID=UPI0033EC67F6